MFYAVHDHEGELVSVGSVVATPEELDKRGLTAVEIGEDAPDLDQVQWDPASRSFVPRPEESADDDG